jgi:CspA family cold shock protein
VSERQQGTVKWFREDKGFGFIEVQDGPDIFVHISETTQVLREGDIVTFVVKEGKKGPIATVVESVN